MSEVESASLALEPVVVQSLSRVLENTDGKNMDGSMPGSPVLHCLLESCPLSLSNRIIQ